MDLVTEKQTKTQNDFAKILENATQNMNNYERSTMQVILNLTKSAQDLKNNKLRMTKYMIDDIDKLIKLISLSNKNSESLSIIINEIKALQSNLSRYMETTDPEILESINRNLKEINTKVMEKTPTYLSDEEKKEQEKLKKNELNYLYDRQNKLHYKVDTLIQNELNKLHKKPLDFKKLDKAYRNLYIALEIDDKEEIINKRGRLIRLLEANQNKIKKQYKDLIALEYIKEVFESNESRDIKLQRINEILRKKENIDYFYYFSNLTNDYDELRKTFFNLYDYLEVNKTKLYSTALKEELKRHGEVLKEAYQNELIDKKHQVTVLSSALPKTLGYSIKKLSNTMKEFGNSRTGRKRVEKGKEALVDVGRVIITPPAIAAKFIANNWYTLSLLRGSIKEAKKQKAEHDRQVQLAEQRILEQAKQDALDLLRRQNPNVPEQEILRLYDYILKTSGKTPLEILGMVERGEIQFPKQIPKEPAERAPQTQSGGAVYDDPEFEEEVARLMKTGQFKSIEEAEHQANINLGRIAPDEAPEETPEESPEETPQETNQEIPQETPEEVPQEESQLTSEHDDTDYQAQFNTEIRNVRGLAGGHFDMDPAHDAPLDPSQAPEVATFYRNDTIMYPDGTREVTTSRYHGIYYSDGRTIIYDTSNPDNPLYITITPVDGTDEFIYRQVDGTGSAVSFQTPKDASGLLVNDTELPINQDMIAGRVGFIDNFYALSDDMAANHTLVSEEELTGDMQETFGEGRVKFYDDNSCEIITETARIIQYPDGSQICMDLRPGGNIFTILQPTTFGDQDAFALTEYNRDGEIVNVQNFGTNPEGQPDFSNPLNMETVEYVEGSDKSPWELLLDIPFLLIDGAFGKTLLGPFFIPKDLLNNPLTNNYSTQTIAM